jgi:uncharacterized protein YyaL (SSP411 family)
MGIDMENMRKSRDENERIREFIELDKSMLPPDGGERFNRLIFSTSPYLLQHADNPVDWYPWGEEAFDKARRENRPVFLSIGYSTCHWCHVMEHESFEDPEVAEVMNRSVVAVKVDREERPDIDSQYMTVAQMMTGRGGWPLTILMTPDRKPFYAATYLPKTGRHGLPGLIEVIGRVAEIWNERSEQIRGDCEKIVAELSKTAAPASAAAVEGDAADRAYRQLARLFDPVWGGFGDAPKFPMPGYCTFLLRYWKRHGSEMALRMVRETLQRIRSGGIYDQVGFGVHRYAVDREWLVPHFEKMLYDQALLSLVSAEYTQASGDPFGSVVASETCDYVLSELTSPEGGFYSGQDADTEGKEGLYYLWKPDELEQTLGRESAGLYGRIFDITDTGNFEGKSIPHQPSPLELHAEALGIGLEELSRTIEQMREELLKERESRVRPFRDEKILASWNGLMIAALAMVYRSTGEGRYLAAAEKAAAFIMERLYDPSGRLLRSYHLGQASVPAFLEDYAFLVWGLIELYGATGDPAQLSDALTLNGEMIRLFRDVEGGGFFESGIDTEAVLVRMKRGYDDVFPSGNSVAIINLVRLGRMTDDPSLAAEGEHALSAFLGSASRQPLAYLQMLIAHEFITCPEVRIEIVGDRGDSDFRKMIMTIGRRFIPNLTIRFTPARDEETRRRMSGNRVTAYVCTGVTCLPPAAGPEALEPVLEEYA